MDKKNILKKVQNLSNKYLISQYKIVQLKDSVEDHRCIIKFEKALSRLDLNEKFLLKNEFLDLKDKYWWKKYFNKNIFYAMKTSACLHFLELIDEK